MFPFKWQFYTEAREAWDSMLFECSKAEISIDIEQYIFANDVVGRPFIDLLKEKSKSGIKVRLLVDMVGSSDFYYSKAPKELEDAGVSVRFFNVVSFWRIHNFTSWFFRDHRKVLIVDQKVGFTGGLGIRENMKDWHDVTAKVEGQVVNEMHDSFGEMWSTTTEKSFIKKIIKYRKQKQKRVFISNDPYFKKRFLYYSLIESLRSAKKSISIINPYFIPERRFSRVLRQASRRGVDVKVLLPNEVDIPILETASDSTLEKFLKSGVKIYKYNPEFIHTKIVIVDDNWATFGSFNLDNLSFVYNHEANIITTDIMCVSDLKEIFSEALDESHEIKYIDWRNRPLIRKIKEFITIPIRSFL